MSRIVKQLAHVCLFSTDLGRTEAFYRDVLGLPVVFRFLKEGREIGFYLDAGGRSHVEVFVRDAVPPAATPINHLCLECESLDAAIAHVRAQGVEVTDKSFGCDETWQAWMADPDGVRIELFEYTDASAQFRGGDRIATW